MFLGNLFPPSPWQHTADPVLTWSSDLHNLFVPLLVRTPLAVFLLFLDNLFRPSPRQRTAGRVLTCGFTGLSQPRNARFLSHFIA